MPEPLVVYTYANCSTCRDAVKWLRAHAIAFEEKPIYETPPSVPELRRMLARQSGELRRLFNTSGLSYKALDLKTKLPQLSEAQALELLASNGRLVKRPFVLGDKVGLVGFKPEAWAAALARA
ncbi:arsenate reductase family protein [Opitutus terrae]|uniref:Arsenate reductase and related n=1 Tax=Opitutus terrae (strain DSM 11246 / JCM 15787 / PB90-1) TaxID=452637 RepID=B1ZPU9_OPITP|nr:arsenate reductase family protein [Opitutus terrae]ACB75552.1 arsenate reductase and related [Opitutus terrae PB90-1]